MAINLRSTIKVTIYLAATLAMATCAAFTGQETGSAYINDAAITSQIKPAFVTETELGLFQIHVETIQGTVHLTGLVEIANNEQLAVTLAEQIKGVQQVRDELVVDHSS